MRRYETIWRVVSRIPRGRVASYGQVAAIAGFPRRARLVGRALSQAPEQLHLPWHRVVGASGRLALPPGSPALAEQVRRLRDEGVAVRNGRVPMRVSAWAPSLDELVWGPPLLGADEAADDGHPDV